MLIKKWVREWSRSREFNSFNSWKGLLYSQWYAAVSRGEFLPPVEASLDPIHRCNLLCSHCNAHGYLCGPSADGSRMEDSHLMRLVSFLGDWGVKAVCFGGGGEPTMHTKLGDALLLGREKGMDTSIATNGTLLDERLIDTAADCCRWIGISVDAACGETYRKGRKEDLFGRVAENMEKAVRSRDKKGSNCEITFKFLIFSYNQNEIFDACRLARDLGADSFHARPADFCHQGMGSLKGIDPEYDLENIKDQIAKCHELEDEGFGVFTIMHKFDETLVPKKDFSQCYAAPLIIQLCADGKVYFCPDQRLSPEYELGSHFPDPENIIRIWSSDKYRDLVFGTGKSRCGSRCTLTAYNRQCEELFIGRKDPMCRWFV